MGLEELRFVAMTLARFTTFLTHSLIFGLPVILLLVFRPAFSGLDETWVKGRARVSERLEGLMQSCVAAALVATVITVVLQATVISDLKGEDIGTSSFLSVFESSYGKWYLVRIPLLVGLAVLLGGRIRGWALARAEDDAQRPSISWWSLWIALGLTLLTTLTFSGHASVAIPRRASELNDLIHLGSSSIWIAGIVMLCAILPSGWRRRPPVDRLQLLAPAVSRFARIAMVAIGVVAVTGTLNSVLHVGALNDLWDTSYGRWVMVKIVFFLAILGLGGINHFYVRRRLEDAIGSDRPSDAQAIFRRTIAVELALVFLVLGATGVLVGLNRTGASATSPSGAQPGSSVLR